MQHARHFREVGGLRPAGMAELGGDGAPREQERGAKGMSDLLRHDPEYQAMPAMDTKGRALALGLLAIWTIWIWIAMDIRNGVAGSTFLHLVLLPFHEAGH